MSLVPRRNQLRLIAGLALAALSALAIAACGDEEAQSLAYTATSEGKTTTLEGPSSASTGLADISFENKADGEAELQLIRVEGDHSAEETVEGLEAAMKGKPFPDWFFAGGGVGTLKPGESKTVTQVLKPGTYYAFNTESQGPPDAKSVPALEVTGEEVDEEVGGEEIVTAGEYAFKADELSSGEVEIDFENGGAQPHHLIASRLKGDGTAEDVEQFFKTEKGEPPLEEKGTKSTAVIEGGEGQAVTLDLEPGRYVFYCFISDRQGGPPHALKGMVDEVEVK